MRNAPKAGRLPVYVARMDEAFLLPDMREVVRLKVEIPEGVVVK